MILLLPMFVHSQDFQKVPFVDGKVEFDTVIQVKEMSAKELYSRVKLIISEMYNSGKAVIDVSDEGMFIVVKGITKYPLSDFLGTLYVNLDHSLKFQFKDERVKITLNNLVVSTVPFESIAIETKGYKFSPKIRQQHIAHVIEFWDMIQQTIISKTAKANTDNW